MTSLINKLTNNLNLQATLAVTGQIEGAQSSGQKKVESKKETETFQSSIFSKLDVAPLRVRYPDSSNSVDLKGLSKEKKEELKAELFRLLGLDSKVPMDKLFDSAKVYKSEFKPEVRVLEKKVIVNNLPLTLVISYRHMEGYKTENLEIHSRDLISISVKDKKEFPPGLFFQFSSSGEITDIFQSRDPFNAFGNIFSSLGAVKISSLLKEAPKEDLGYYRRTQDLYKKGVILETVFDKKKISKQRPIQYVPVEESRVADLETPLGTHGLSPCAALIIIDKKANKHYMAHVNGSFDFIKDINQALNQIDLKKSEFHIVTGTASEQIPRELFNTLTQEKDVSPEKITIIPTRFDVHDFHQATENIVSHNGQLYRASKYWGDYEDSSEVLSELIRQANEYFKTKE